MAKAFWDSEKVLGDVAKAGTKSTFYRLKAVTKNGRSYVDVREHYTKADGSEQYTTKGSAVPVENLRELTDALITAANDLEE